jgi:FtsP/CotA-like multicopper oxidase with cupredoxin domain
LIRVTTLLLAALASLFAGAAFAAPACPRSETGGIVMPPPDVTSQNGLLQTTLDYVTRTASDGSTLYCFTTTDGLESPTLHVWPGDRVEIRLRNRLPQAAASGMRIADACSGQDMNGGSVNIHFHGMNITPACHSDEVLRTVVNPGQAFTYSFHIPANEPPGLYWYHPHIHGISTKAVQGGATGAIIVEGIESVQSAVADLPQRLVIVRSQAVPGVVLHATPNENLTVNYVPVSFPHYTPAVMQFQPGQKEFWRVLNASADTVLDLQLRYDNVAQKLGIVALDGVPTRLQDGTSGVLSATHILIPPAGRAEFTAVMPAANVHQALFMTRAIDTGPAGDADPGRRLAVLTPAPASAMASALPPPTARPAGADRFAGLDTATVTTHRKLYFSEASLGPGDGQTNFFITVDGDTPTLYDPANPPAITTTRGAVEDWVIENRSTENHEFHIHQIHFKLLQRDRQPVPAADRQMLDTVQVPYWTGSGPYPSVTLRMDFRGPVVGDFVYHCHILDHEDGGMMAIIRVLAKPTG